LPVVYSKYKNPVIISLDNQLSHGKIYREMAPPPLLIPIIYLYNGPADPDSNFAYVRGKIWKMRIFKITIPVN